MAFLIGNLIGRLLMSVFIVWLVVWCSKKFSVHDSVRALKRPIPIFSITLVFILGVLSGGAGGKKS